MLQPCRTVKKLVASKFRTTSNYNADCMTQRLFECKQHLRKAHTLYAQLCMFLQVLHATKLVLHTIVQTQWNSIANRLTAKQVLFIIFLYIATKCFANNAQSNIRLLLFAKLRRTWHTVADCTTQRCFKQEQLHR